ncbi:winged helix-turn-helix domain-containing protein [Dactylosporangium aurantiacum]|uniref:Winged helix-turn-helix domain-containing protein n=1 Tax=Dactylosporangium aurantiacum TaxID=35754 RepID=A0A9Q9IPE1_9ACTN|nr:BTAD domain-containing putative transcriptional regulator [Dactylosporangium aurantiacum]MDG6104126.1 BTAD domain-containing putative transcriptional regulator [Dactylosporangium aurantiacum]UWZ56865.1 winged helix-turn-helix domain-containing protein [Dactylosporangium aurantiacum]
MRTPAAGCGEPLKPWAGLPIAAAVDVRVLGQIEIIDGDGRRMTGDDLPRRARQVLGVLAARHDRVQSKDALADAVWGADLPGNATAALEHYVSVLRRALQPGVPTGRSFIVTRAGGYVFATDRARLDLAELRAAAKVAERRPGQLDVRERIVELAPELPFAEDEYADWAAPARAEVKAVLVAALLDLAEPAAAVEPARALRLAREATELEPFTERGYRLAMLAGARLGRADEVVRWFDLCRRALADDLGIAPSADTTSLRDRLLAELSTAAPATAGTARAGDRRRGDRRKADRRAAAQPTTTTPAAQETPAPAAPPAGRRLSVVRATDPAPGTADGTPFVGRAAELAVLAGGPGVVHVTGPAGAGKSALLARLREEEPGRVGLGRGPGPGGALRLGWLRAALHQLGRPADEVLDAAMRERRWLHPAELDAIAGGLGGRTVAVDDAEHLDAHSVSELRWLRERGLRVVVSYRYPSAIADRPLHALDADLVLRLDPLGERDLPAGVLAASGGIPALVAPACGGDPALAEAVATHLARQRTRWMPPAAWEVLRLTAALGTLRVEQLAAAGGLDLDEVLAAVDRLVHAHLLAEGPGGSVRHRSDLVRSAVAAQVSAAHGHHLRDRLATA